MTKLAIDFAGDYARFETTYIRYRRKRTEKDLTYLYDHIKHNFVKWQEIITSRNYKEDITVYTLMCLLDKDSKTPVKLETLIRMFETWMRSMSLTWFDIWTEAFIIHMAKLLRIAKRFNKPNNLSFLISKDMKMNVFAKIRHVYFLMKREVSFSSQKKQQVYYFENTIYSDIYFDSDSFIEELEKDNQMLKVFMKVLFHKDINRNEMEKICHLTSQKLLSNLEITQT
jgi:hypothetical protein